MSEIRPDIDLGALARRRDAPPPPRRRWRRFLLPAGIVLGLLLVLLWSTRDALRAARTVTVVRPRAGAAAAPAGSVAFQAAGWVEPDPYPHHASSLIAGTLREVLVQESDAVQAGQPVARLVDDDARLKVQDAEAGLAMASAERDRARVEHASSKEAFAAAIELTEAVEGADALVRFRESEVRLAALAAAKGEADLEVAKEELEIQRHLAEEGAAGPRQVELASAKARSAEAALESLRVLAVKAEAELEQAAVRRRRVRRDQELRIEDRRRVDSARAAEAAADAAVLKAETALAAARLELARTTVLAPAAGIVLDRLKVPGEPVAPGGAETASVCSLYDPARLRIRVDVPQEEIGKSFVGQKALVVSEGRRRTPYPGEVIRRVQRADIQKVTLEIQVRVLEPDELLRPEMLCQVRFLAPAAEAPGTAPTSALFVPARLLLPGDLVWVVDPSGRHARRRAIGVGSREGEWVEVVSGLTLADKLIDQGRDGLEDGAPVRIEGSE